jgi:pseudouridine synthase
MASALKTLERVLSKAGVGSRTEARAWIHARRVSVNGTIVENPDHWIDFSRDRIEIDGQPLKPLARVYVLLYKPTGYLSTYKDPEGRKTVYDLLDGVPSFVGTVGRLDEDSSGLLLLSNDTRLAERLTNPAYHVPKTYLVKCATRLADEALAQLRDGVELSDGRSLPARVERVRDQATKTFLEITLTEGRNRQVRRMIEAVGSRVLKLVRIRIGPLEIGDLTSGSWRVLTEAEVRQLYGLTGLSAEAKPRATKRPNPKHGARSKQVASPKQGPPSRGNGRFRKPR